MDACRVACDHGTRRHVTRDDCTCANNGIGADRQAWQHDCASTDEGAVANRDEAAQRRPRCDVHAVAQAALVVDRSLVIDDARIAEKCVSGDDRLRKHLRTSTKLRAGAH